jgi:hypothetical protein
MKCQYENSLLSQKAGLEMQKKEEKKAPTRRGRRKGV